MTDRAHPADDRARELAQRKQARASKPPNILDLVEATEDLNRSTVSTNELLTALLDRTNPTRIIMLTALTTLVAVFLSFVLYVNLSATCAAVDNPFCDRIAPDTSDSPVVQTILEELRAIRESQADGS